MSAIDPPEKKPRGCFFYGCITSLVVLFVIAVVAFFAVRYVVNAANAMIMEYTETQPMTFPKVELPADGVKQLKARVAAFQNAMDAHTNGLPLVLTGPEINALLASNTNFKDLKDMVYVEIVGDKVKGELSMPVGKYFRFPLVHTKDRYLNGTGTFIIGVSNQMLSVYVDTLEVKGRPLPPQFMMQLRGQDMAAEINKNPTNAAAISRYESVVVEDGKITVKAKAN